MCRRLEKKLSSLLYNNSMVELDDVLEEYYIFLD